MDERTLMQRLEEADKLLRKGELAEARAVYQQLVVEAPPDLQLQLTSRIERMDELGDPRQGVATARAEAHASAQAQAEAAYNAGEIDQAVEIYAIIVEARPDDQLARERMTELLKEKALLLRNKHRTPSRAISVGDMNNAGSASTQESGPLGVALHHKGEKPAGQAMDLDVSDDAQDVDLMDEVLDDMPEMDVPGAQPLMDGMQGLQPPLVDPVIPDAPAAAWDIMDDATFVEPPQPMQDPLPAVEPSSQSLPSHVVLDVVSPAARAPLPDTQPEFAAPPETTTTAALPDDPVDMLQELLARIQAHRHPAA